MSMPQPEEIGPEVPDRQAPIYAELRAVAQRLMAGERRSHTLQPTALVHEAWLRLAAKSADVQAPPGMALFATAMRNLLVDHARGKGAEVHGGKVKVKSIESAADVVAGEGDGIALIDLDDALRKLSEENPDHARVAEMKVFGGMTIDEIVAAIGMSKSTVEAWWRIARARLMRLLDSSGEEPGPDDRSA